VLAVLAHGAPDDALPGLLRQVGDVVRGAALVDAAGEARLAVGACLVGPGLVGTGFVGTGFVGAGAFGHGSQSSVAGLVRSAALRDAAEQDAADERGERRGRDRFLLGLRADLDRRGARAVGARLTGLAHERNALLVHGVADPG